MEKRNAAIELYRFVIAIILALFHLNAQYLGLDNSVFLNGGYLGVEFFFILSGYLLAKSINNKQVSQDIRPQITAFTIVKGKVKSLYPAYMLSMFIYFIMYVGIKQISSIPQAIKWFANEIYALLFLNAIGIPDISSFAGSIWYLSALIINTYFIAWLLLEWKDVYIGFLAPAICIMFYGYCGMLHHSLSVQELWIGPIYGALGRGFADMSIGVITYNIFEKMDVDSSYKRIIWSVIEILAFLYAFHILNEGFSVNDFKVVILFSIIIGLGFKQKTWLALKLNKKIFICGGGISYHIYLIHLCFSTMLTIYAKGLKYENVISIYIIIVIISASILKVGLSLLEEIKN